MFFPTAALGRTADEISDNSPTAVSQAKDEYLEDHEIYGQLNTIITELLDERPADPHLYVAKRLAEWSQHRYGGEPIEEILKRIEGHQPTSRVVMMDTSITIDHVEKPHNRKRTLAAGSAQAPMTSEADEIGDVPSPKSLQDSDLQIPVEDRRRSHTQAPEGQSIDDTGLELPSLTTAQRPSTCFMFSVDEASDGEEPEPSEVPPAKYFQPKDPLDEFSSEFQTLQELLRNSFAVASDSRDSSFFAEAPLVSEASPATAQHPAGYLDLLYHACQSSLTNFPSPSHTVKGAISVRDVAFKAAFGIVNGATDPEVLPSILHALDFGLNLQLVHLTLGVIAHPRTRWDGLIVSGFTRLVGRDGRTFENPMVKKLKFALINELFAAVRESASFDASRAQHFETVIRETVTQVIEKIITVNLHCNDRDAHRPLLSILFDEDLASDSIYSQLVHRLSHVPIADIVRLVRLAAYATDDLKPFVDELLLLGLCDAASIASIAMLLWNCCDTSTLQRTGQATVLDVTLVGEDVVWYERSVFAVRLVSRVKGAVENTWMDVIEEGGVTFDLRCPSAVSILSGINVKMLLRVFHKSKPESILTAVDYLAKLAQGTATLNRTFFALACAGIYSSQLPRFISGLMLSCSSKPLPFCLWLTGVAQNIRGGLRAVFNVKQLVDDDGTVGPQQALLDIQLSRAVSKPPIQQKDATYTDAVSPIRRSNFTSEDLLILLNAQTWDFVQLGVQYDQPTAWLEFLDQKVQRIAKTALQVGEVLQIASNPLRHAQRIEQHLLAEQFDADVSRNRLPLILRAVLCTNDAMISLILACLTASPPPSVQKVLEAEWALVEDPRPVIIQALQKSSSFNEVRFVENAAELINPIVTQLLQNGINRNLVDKYIYYLSLGNVWNATFHQYHEHFVDGIIHAVPSGGSEKSWKFFLHQLTVTMMNRVTSLLTFSMSEGDALQKLRSWHTAMTKEDDGLKEAMMNARHIITRRGGTRQADYLKKNEARTIACFSQLASLAAEDTQDLVVVAIEDALMEVMHWHHYTIVNCILNEFRDFPIMSSSQDATVISVHLGRTVELLAFLVIPKVSGLEAVVHHVRKNGLISGASSASQSFVGSIPEPTKGMGLSMSTVPAKGTSSSESTQRPIWQIPLSSEVAFLMTNSLDASKKHLTGWYAQSAAENLQRLAENLLFDDYFHFSGVEFQQCLQDVCFAMMRCAVSKENFLCFQSSADEAFQSRVSNKSTVGIFALLKHVGQRSFQLAVEEDRRSIAPLLPQDSIVIDSQVNAYRDIIARRASEMPIIALFALFDAVSPREFGSRAAVIDELARVSYTALSIMVRDITYIETVTSNSAVLRFIHAFLALTVGGQPWGFALVSAYGDLMLNCIADGNATTTVRWSRVMLSITTYLEDRTMKFLKRPTTSTVFADTFDKNVNIESLDRSLKSVELCLFAGGELTNCLFSSGSYQQYMKDMCHSLFDMMIDGFEAGQETAETIMVDVLTKKLEATSTDLVAAAIHFETSCSVMQGMYTKITPAQEAIIRLIYSAVNTAMIALDGVEQRAFVEAHKKRKEIFQALQSLDSADLDGIQMERSNPLMADIFLRNNLRIFANETTKTIISLMSNWHVNQAPNTDALSDQDDEDEIKTANDPRFLPPSFYISGLAPSHVVDTLVMQGIIPRDTTFMASWAPRVMTETQLLPSHMSLVALNKPRPRASSAASVQLQNNHLTTAAMLWRTCLRFLNAALRDWLMQAAATTQTREEIDELAKHLTSNQTLVYLNLLKNEAQTKQQFASEWQMPYLVSSLLGLSEAEFITLNPKVKESRDFIIVPKLLNTIFVDVLFPISSSFARSLVNTTRFAVTPESKFVPLTMQRHLYKQFAMQRSQLLHAACHFPLSDLMKMQSMWSACVNRVKEGSAGQDFISIVTKYTAMDGKNVSVALAMLSKVLEKVPNVFCGSTFMSIALSSILEFTNEEEGLVLQLFGAQWGPVAHSLLIALKVHGAPPEMLPGFLRLFRALRIVTRCTTAMKKSQPQAVHYHTLPHKMVSSFLAIMPRVQGTDSQSKQLNGVIAGIEQLCKAAKPQHATLRQWIDEAILSSFTRHQLTPVVRKLSDSLPNDLKSINEVEAIRWILLVVFFAVRQEDEIHDKLQLPPSPPPSIASLRVPVNVSSKVRSPPIDFALREKCIAAMVLAASNNVRVKPLATLILDFVVDVLDRFHINLVDAFSQYEFSLVKSLKECSATFKDLQSMCLGLMSSLGGSFRTSPTFADHTAMQQTCACLCRALYAVHYAPTSTTARDDSEDSQDFPLAEIKIFGYVWLRLLPDMFEIYSLALVKFRKLLQERAKVTADPEDLRASVLLLQKIAVDANDELKRMSPVLINYDVEEWAKSVKDMRRLNRVALGCVTQALLESVDQCDASVAFRELFSSSATKPAVQKAVWYIFNSVQQHHRRASAYVPNGTNSSPLHSPQRSPSNLLSAAGVRPTNAFAAPDSPPTKVETVLQIELPQSPVEQTPTAPSVPVAPLAAAVPSAVSALLTAPQEIAPASPNSASSGGMPQYTMQEVAKHKTRKDCWVVIDGKVFDVSALVATHPGGTGAILAKAGKEATTAFEENHDADGYSRKKINVYYIGDLAQ